MANVVTVRCCVLCAVCCVLRAACCVLRALCVCVFFSCRRSQGLLGISPGPASASTTLTCTYVSAVPKLRMLLCLMYRSRSSSLCCAVFLACFSARMHIDMMVSCGCATDWLTITTTDFFMHERISMIMCERQTRAATGAPGATRTRPSEFASGLRACSTRYSSATATCCIRLRLAAAAAAAAATECVFTVQLYSTEAHGSRPQRFCSASRHVSLEPLLAPRVLVYMT
jgi:hypothetical protein